MEQLGGVGRRRGRVPEPEPEIQEATGFGLTVEGLSTGARQRLGLSADQEGVVVTDVEYGSAASDRGIRPNMVIIGINDRPIEDIADWRATLDGLRPGESVKIDVLDGEQTTYFFLRVPAEN
jgi:serine protease Do